jgi:HK97 family phage prohead protease
MTIHKKTIDRAFEFKAVKDDGTFEGYASVYGEIDSHRDVVIKGAFNKSLDTRYRAKGRKFIPLLDQHDTRLPIGVLPIDDIKEDDFGLFVRGHYNMDVQRARESHALAKQGALTGLSIGYSTLDDAWSEDGMTRILKEVDLWEISPVTFPSGDSARIITVKSLAGLDTLSDCEQVLRDAGWSKSETTTFVSRVKALAMRSDSADDEDAIEVAVKNALKTLRS